MKVSLPAQPALRAAMIAPAAPKPPATDKATTGGRAEGTEDEVRKAFESFVGQTLFGQMLKAMRKTVGKPAYFHGGRAEEIFTGQLDQVLAEKISEASGDRFGGPMYELFLLGRK